jgi:hypothetical protein
MVGKKELRGDFIFTILFLPLTVLRVVSYCKLEHYLGIRLHSDLESK